MATTNTFDYEPEDFDVSIAQMLVATAEQADDAIDERVQQVLNLLRERMSMDVVFVSHFIDGRRVFRRVSRRPGVDHIAPGQSDPLESSWCQRVVDGRLPEFVPDAAPFVASGQVPAPGFPIGTHLSTPVVLGSGKVYGTLCCFSRAVEGRTSETDLKRLRYTASLLADKIDRQG